MFTHDLLHTLQHGNCASIHLPTLHSGLPRFTRVTIFSFRKCLVYSSYMQLINTKENYIYLKGILWDSKGILWDSKGILWDSKGNFHVPSYNVKRSPENLFNFILRSRLNKVFHEILCIYFIRIMFY